MKTTSLPLTFALKGALSLLILSLTSTLAKADSVTYYGDFFDDFGPGPSYSSDDAFSGSFIAPFFEEVVGIPKFDPSLGTLTDIIVEIEEETLFYYVDGGVIGTELDDSEPGFSVEFYAPGDIGLWYETPDSLSSVIFETFELSGICGGGPGDGECEDGIFMFSASDGVLSGSASILSEVVLSDFVGAGDVETLILALFLADTGDFFVENAEGSAEVFWDVYAGVSSSPEDEVVSVTYVFTPVPLPAAAWFFGVSLVGLMTMKRRKN